MLTLSFTRRQLRHTVCVTLFAWMIALLSGVANACLTQLNAQGEAGSISSQADRAGTARRATRAGEHVHHHGENEDDGLGNHSANEVCLEFCADESSALTKSRAPPGRRSGPHCLGQLAVAAGGAGCRCPSVDAGRTAWLGRAAAVHPLAAVDDLARSAGPLARAAAGPSSIGPSIGWSVASRHRLASEQPASFPFVMGPHRILNPLRSSSCSQFAHS